jgi:uncharacterized protein
MIHRIIKSKIEESLSFFPAVGILGPRQVGKTTLAKQVLEETQNSIYLDLEKAKDRAKLREPELFLEQFKDRLVCLDEIQRAPELFQELRSLIDEHRTPARFMILGSATVDLLRQSSETLAGRIAYHDLSPLTVIETGHEKMIHHWVYGGFPDSFLAPTPDLSQSWRDNFIRTFLERDIGSLGLNLPSEQLRRFWTMLSHHHSGILNKSNFSKSLGVSVPTVQRWLDLLVQTFMVRSLRPYSSNTKKTLVKSPKVYIRDSGILHQLLGLSNYEDVMGHTISGASWEGYALENILESMRDWDASFYRTQNGAELDLILEKGGKRIGVEFKLSSSPKVEKGSHFAREDLGLELIHVITPSGEGERVGEHVRIDSPKTFLEFVKPHNSP